MSRSSDFVRFLRGARRALFGPPKPYVPDPCSVRHQWEEVGLEKIGDEDGVSGYDHILACKRCGERKVFRT